MTEEYPTFCGNYIVINQKTVKMNKIYRFLIKPQISSVTFKKGVSLLRIVQPTIKNIFISFNSRPFFHYVFIKLKVIVARNHIPRYCAQEFVLFNYTLQ